MKSQAKVSSCSYGDSSLLRSSLGRRGGVLTRNASEALETFCVLIWLTITWGYNHVELIELYIYDLCTICIFPKKH